MGANNPRQLCGKIYCHTQRAAKHSEFGDLLAIREVPEPHWFERDRTLGQSIELRQNITEHYLADTMLTDDVFSMDDVPPPRELPANSRNLADRRLSTSNNPVLHWPDTDNDPNTTDPHNNESPEPLYIAYCLECGEDMGDSAEQLCGKIRCLNESYRT